MTWILLTLRTEMVGEPETFIISDSCPAIKEDQDKGKKPATKWYKPGSWSEANSPDSPPSAQVNHQLLVSIDARLRKLDILDELRQDIQDLTQTSDFKCATLDEYKKKTDILGTTVTKPETTMKEMKAENGQLKEKMLELTARSMRDN